ncbi:hypothetical protein HD553DRAFT_343956 [Filobasidium floriforme]|uniref:uncharacterized protein n=1 Tax=Filobasidium floriforme TaxID=5210 RepID=UPI001E8EE054|nr:uncharacterized protein HD553DRAFT_343956 [Filobasidium floriforme]KAH8081883.1 hypothetical protein HD553DRAFT_343956 [Filobasidium floriforme]
MPRAPKAKATATSSAEEDTKPYNRTPSAPPASPGKKGKTWTKADKIKLLLEVIGWQKPDFDMISTKFEGRTRSQVYDQWRQQVLPGIKATGSVEGRKASE